MRWLIVLLVLCVFVLSGYFLVRRSGDVVEAFNHTNLIPYEAVAGQYLEPKI